MVTPMFENYNDMVNLEDLQKMLGIGKNKAYELLKNKEIENFKIGREYKIPKVAIINYINSKIGTNNTGE
jgi:excisionase family DNA binding protein